MYLVSEHYRTPVTFTTEFVGRAGERLKRLRSAERNLRFLAAECAKRPSEGDTFATGKLADALVEQADFSLDQFREAMDDDLNTPRAISAIETLAKQINTTNDEVARDPALATSELQAGLDQAGDIYHKLVGVLGLELTEPEPALEDGDIQRLVDERTEARKGKDFPAADRIRQQLLDMDIIIEDRPQ